MQALIRFASGDKEEGGEAPAPLTLVAPALDQLLKKDERAEDPVVRRAAQGAGRCAERAV